MFTMGPPMWGGAASDPYAGNVYSLLHFNEADGTATPGNSLGSATITNDGSASAPSTNAVKSASPKLGAGSWLAAGGSTGLKVSKVTSVTAAYTIEFFFKPVTFGSFGRFLGVTSSGAGIEFMLSYAGGNIYYVDNTATNRATTGVVSTGTWYHMAICFDGTNVKLYLNGTLIFTSSTYARSLTGTTINIGLGCSTGGGGADGTANFDEFRWTHGVNRYPSGLTTPTSEFPDS